MNKKDSFRVFYYLDSPEAEVFQFLKRVNALEDIAHAMTNFYLPRVRIDGDNFEDALFNFESFTKSHLDAQQKILSLVRDSDLKKFREKKLKHSRTSINISFDLHNLLQINEVSNYLSKFSNREMSKIIKVFSTNWYLLTAKYQMKNYYSYSELSFIFERKNNFILNEINYLRNFIDDPSKLNIDIDNKEDKLSNVLGTKKLETNSQLGQEKKRLLF